jgi:hypothetical protein
MIPRTFAEWAARLILSNGVKLKYRRQWLPISKTPRNKH